MTAEKYNADCVCADMRQVWREIKIPKRYKAECFYINEPKSYDENQIRTQLYISCFGVNNYPVVLTAKIYKTELITQVIDSVTCVKFMGDDLSVTVRMLPITKKLVVIPDIIYNYRIGGGTSRFMPDMLDDFLALYRLKTELISEVEMPQDALYFINVELMNVIISWLKMCYVIAGYTEEQLLRELKIISELPEVKTAVSDLCNRTQVNKYAKSLFGNNYKEICDTVVKQSKKENKKRIMKKILYKLG